MIIYQNLIKLLDVQWLNFNLFMEIYEITWKWSRADRQLPLQLWLSDLIFQWLHDAPTLSFIWIIISTVKYRTTTVTLGKSSNAEYASTKELIAILYWSEIYMTKVSYLELYTLVLYRPTVIYLTFCDLSYFVIMINNNLMHEKLILWNANVRNLAQIKKFNIFSRN